jgi:hypothetical protein
MKMKANVLLFPQKNNNEPIEPIINADYFNQEKFDYIEIFKLLDQLNLKDK